MEDYMDGSVDGDDIFPCKGCGEILEEGKAFELAGNRWHLNCFRCNTCNTLLDSDANLLLLGDGSLICNSCTYSCSACGDKIEDLAILTGEQAFCAACFRCRNCKRKIENLRYAKTSQGIFCMSCHESLMARRRKKAAKAAQTKAREKDGSPMVVEKSLPALPPNAIPPNAFSNDRVDPDSDTPVELPTELSPRPRPPYPRADSDLLSNSRPTRSPERPSDQPGLSLSAHTYRPNRNSALFSGSDSANTAADDQSFFIPVALDPSPLPSATPRSVSELPGDANKRSRDKDYFSIQRQTERKPDSQTSTPHIAFQEKGRQASSDHDNIPSKSLGRKLSKSSKTEKNGSSNASPIGGDDRSQTTVNGKPEEFKLQDAPKSRKLNTRTNSQQSNSLPEPAGSRESGSGRVDKDMNINDPSQHVYSSDRGNTPRSSQDSRAREEDESRQGDPLAATPGNASRPIARKELPHSASRSVNGFTRPDPTDPRSSGSYMAPRAPPAPPGHATVQDSPSAGGELKSSPKLPRWSAGGDFSMDEDMARILGTDEGSSSIMRRVSSAVRHGRTNSTESSGPPRGHARSVSETTRTTASPRWPKTPIAEDAANGASHDITSPLSLTSGDDNAALKIRLRSSEQRVAELERQFNSEKDLKNLAQKVEEKRKTVSVLDTQTELMIRQLEALAGYVERAKETKKPVDPRDLEESAIKDFVQRLEKLKQSMVASLEQLHAERDQLIEEKNRAIADRDRARVEFEQLVSKNAQLADLNNDITHQIQERVKNHSDARLPSNGLGIYHHNKGASNNSVSLDAASIQTGTTIITPEHEEPILEARPTVVKIEKKNFAKWKKGSKAVAQNIAKGVNRTVVAFQQPERHPQGTAGESIGLPYNMTVTPVESPVSHAPPNGPTRQQADAGRQGFFGFKKTQTIQKQGQGIGSTVSTPAAAEPPSVLFGSELADRAEYERRQIPSVITRCIEEVELRGMEIEGIYRKTGGNSQVKSIQEGFDKNENFDISDPDMDITAVTSVLKQYFRKLPTPLLTYDIYDRVLETNSLASDSEKCDHLQNVFSQLPRQHKDCLEFLMFHLSRVASREGENLMTPRNLAVVFAPTIMRDTNIEREMTDMHAKNNAVQFIIENSHNIFS